MSVRMGFSRKSIHCCAFHTRILVHNIFIDDVAIRVEGIANSAAEQHAGIGQINQAITQMDDMTQQNAALVEQASAASEALNEQAGVLNNLVGFFAVGSARNYN